MQGLENCWRCVFSSPWSKPRPSAEPAGPLGLHMVPGDRGAGMGASRALEWQVTAHRSPGGACFPASLRRHTIPSLHAPKPSPLEPGCSKDPLSPPAVPDLWFQRRVMRLGASSNAYTLAPQSGVTGPGGCLGPHTVTSSRAGETATCQSRISSFSLRLLTLFAWSCYFPPRVPFISKVTKTQDTLATPFLLCPSRPASTPAILL